ncbi:MAG: hypothetical protein HY225_02160 [Candidatus Vogelbacteria bacterium]|nr:hypothetical protein [Candidatus Vogelbacteria bacterium]
MTAKDNSGSVSIVLPPFKINLFQKPYGNEAYSLKVGEDGSLTVGGKIVEFHPWDLVQMTIAVGLVGQFSAIIRTGKSSLVVKNPLKIEGKVHSENAAHIQSLLQDSENEKVYLSGVTFVPDPELEESYIPNPNSGIVITELINAYVMRLWTVRLVTRNSVTRLVVTQKDVARPDGLNGKDGDKDVLDNFLNEYGGDLL